MCSTWTRLKLVDELKELTFAMWQKGWDEANGGNISVILDAQETEALKYRPGTGISVELMGDIPENMRGRYLLVSATGSYFREIKDEPNKLLGIIYLPHSGNRYERVAGLEGNSPTSELAAHIQTHSVRLALDSKHRVVMHNHATHILAMTHAGPTNERDLTVELWRMITEGVVIFPDGIGLVPWCVCGTQEIARQTNAKMKRCRCVVWQYHGVMTVGASLHEAFGLLETVDKCAEIWLLSQSYPQHNRGIDDKGLRDTAHYFGRDLRKSYLSV